MKTAAERARAYRAEQKEKGIKDVRKRIDTRKGRVRKDTRTGRKRPSGKSGANSKWECGDFIALDGEGESSGHNESFTVGTGRKAKTYEGREHIYTLLAASSGESLYNGGKRLDSQSCIDFLLDLSDAHKKAIFVIFAGSYDINHMLMFGFDRLFIQQIARGEIVEYDYAGIRYQIEYRARKSLTLRRGLTFKLDSKGKYVNHWLSKITVWDVWGFFQDSFIGVMGKWLGKDHKHYALIKDMKARRGDFEHVEQSVINAYNAAELESLVEIMDKVRDAIDGLGLKCKRWDGAGAVAAALMLKHNVKEFKAECPPDVMEAARVAYAGGRIEICKIGHHDGYVYDYDVNSAYPSVMAELPCLAHGAWEEGEGEPPEGFTLVHCNYEFDGGQRFYPLFYRSEKMQICFPSSGEGIYWYPEYDSARQCPGRLHVKKWWRWKQSCHHEPFHWIREYYATRQQWVKAHTEEWQLGGEKIIKLGLNSLYGKCAQQLGGRDGKAPAYHQLEWAGYITSATRARLYNAALKNPDSVIGFATDGIFANVPLPVECSITKEMGAWELKEPIPTGITIPMAGVYWWHYDDDSFSHYSRGFDKDSMKTPARVLEAWKNKETALDVKMQRLIGMGSAAASAALWKHRGRFTTGLRSLRLDGFSHKRSPCRGKFLHKKMTDLDPSSNIEYETGQQTCSYAYPLKWIDSGADMTFENELEFLRELADTEI